MAVRNAVCVLGMLLGGVAAAQSISVYSEFTRIDPFGQPVGADRGAQSPREILSPAMPRNAFTSYHLVVEGRPGQPYTVQIAQNPDGAVAITAYRERYKKAGKEWMPDWLEPVSLPYEGRLGDAAIPEQTAQAFWVDLMPARAAPVRRIKVEPQVYIEDSWIRYPMEVRVVQTSLGLAAVPRVRGVEDVWLPASASALSAWSRMACGFSDENRPAEPALTMRDFIARNAAQDFRFSGGVTPPQLLRWAGVADRAALCQGAKLERPGAEEYLAIRDIVIGARQ